MENNEIRIAIVICTYNRDKYLKEALESIAAQTFNRTFFEAAIIDNNSTDSTAAVAKTFIETNSTLKIRYFFEKQKGLSFARNRGIQETSAPVIAYVDDDAILSPDYLKELDRFFKTNISAVGAGGRVIPKYEEDKEPVWMNKYLNGFIGKVEFGNETKKFSKKMKYPAGCNMIYKREILQKAGGFNNELTFRSDDKDIFLRIKNFSGEIYYLPGAYVYHNIDNRRLQFENFKKLFLKTGNEEKRRIRSEKNQFMLIKKLVEFVFKFGASFILFILFVLKGQYPKGKYVLASQWFTLKGFIQKDVFVR